MPQKEISQLLAELDEIVNSYTSGLKSIEKTMYEKVLNRLKGITTDADGNIKATVNNFKIISQSKSDMAKVLNSKEYLSQVAQVNEYFGKVTSIQTKYFTKMFTDFASPVVIKELQSLAINTTVETLTEAGINDVLINKATRIISDNVRSGRNFAEMTTELKTFIQGSEEVPGKLESYSKQIIKDAHSQYVGNYNKIVSDDLNLEWFEYVGGTIEKTRPMCEHLVNNKPFIHQSEIKGITQGRVDGLTISTQGFMPGTDENNFIINRGGFSCEHLLVPVPPERVPKEVREGIEG